MKHVFQRWVCGFLALVFLVLTVCAAVVYAVDPCLYYRFPQRWSPVFFNERYQTAGMIRHVPADTVLIGTSMAANYRCSDIQEQFGTTALRLTIPDGYLSEFDQAMSLLFREQSPSRVLFGLDVNILTRDESGLTGAMPNYLYNENPLDNLQYLLNKDTLYYSAYVLAMNRLGKGETLDDSFSTDAVEWWNHIEALDHYQRPEQQPQQPGDLFLDNVAANLSVITAWADKHPDTEFDVFFSPYSILFWDKTARLGQTDAVFQALTLACETLLRRPNIRLYAPLFDRDIVLDLDYYCDYIHHCGAVNRLVLERIAAGEDALTLENYREVLANWRSFVVHYDYEPYWTEAFWETWNAAHAAK